MTPYFLIDKEKIESNLKVLRSVMDQTGCRILLAQKCFSLYGLYPLVSRYLSGATSSGLFEARLCHEEMPGKENHVFSPAYREEDIDEICRICDHIVFNTPAQLLRFGQKARDAGLQVGLRINPECSTQQGHAIYDPCAPGSRLGTPLHVLEQSISTHPSLLPLIDGLHFHTLCEQDSDDLKTTLDAVIHRFGKYFSHIRWINFGGGHHITRPGYDLDLLCRCILRMKEEYSLQVYLEPGEAVALDAGELHTTILEIQPPDSTGIRNVILDTSAACHMPDVINMPYVPTLVEPATASDGWPTVLGGNTCLSADVIGTYRFAKRLNPGDRVVFSEMGAYTFCQANWFNGVRRPALVVTSKKDGPRAVRTWSEADFVQACGGG